MKLKTSYLYHMSGVAKPMAAAYITLALLILAMANFALDNSMSLNSIINSSILYAFFTALVDFKIDFLLLIQNGVSRRTILLSRAMAAVTTAFMLVLITQGLYIALNAVFPLISASFVMTSFFANLNIFYNFILMFVVYLSATFVAYLTTMIYYRLDKPGKITVGIASVAVFALDGLLFGYTLLFSVVNFLNFAYSTPMNIILSSICISILCSIGSYLVIRRMPAKE